MGKDRNLSRPRERPARLNYFALMSVQTGSDAAFRELVTRYLDLVYSTALRSVEGHKHRAPLSGPWPICSVSITSNPNTVIFCSRKIIFFGHRAWRQLR